MKGRLAIHRHTFDAMGSTVELILVGGTRRHAAVRFARAEALADEWEWTFSRFRPESELRRLNAAGAPFRASRRLFEGVDAALTAARATHGLFDPTILPALVRLGYDRPFDQMQADGAGVAAPNLTSAPTVNQGWESIVLDSTSGLIHLPDGLHLDLGGIAKGLYADSVADELAGWPGGMISAGGDMRLWGTPPDGDRWNVGIEDPQDAGKNIAWFELESGGVATSGTNRRHWQQAGLQVHHLIDPRTGCSVESDLQALTVVAGTATQAEVCATALFVSGALFDDLPARLPLLTLAVAVTDAGHVQTLYERPGGDPDATRQRAA